MYGHGGSRIVQGEVASRGTADFAHGCAHVCTLPQIQSYCIASAASASSISGCRGSAASMTDDRRRRTDLANRSRARLLRDVLSSRRTTNSSRSSTQRCGATQSCRRIKNSLEHVHTHMNTKHVHHFVPTTRNVEIYCTGVGGMVSRKKARTHRVNSTIEGENTHRR
jgi:hypothetical protein